jgi:GntR family transcriptional regulator, rspAB operon transcriptional repressor
MIATPPPPSMKPRSTAQNIYELLRNDIVRGALQASEPIREVELATRLGVSRTPIREALLRLANLGLVDIFPQSGTRVAPIRAEKVRAAQLIREAVEVEVIRRACRSITAAQIAALGHLIEDQEVAARRNDVGRLFELDEEFHRAIFAAAGQLTVADELEDQKVHLDRLRYAGVGGARAASTTIVEHKMILTGLGRRDEAEAAVAMRMHLRAILPVIDKLAADEAAGSA